MRIEQVEKEGPRLPHPRLRESWPVAQTAASPNSQLLAWISMDIRRTCPRVEE